MLHKGGVTNLELGYKTNLAGLKMFVTLFQTEFDNVPFDDILRDGTMLMRRAETLRRGVEIEGVYQPSGAFDLRLSVTAQEPEYENFTGSALTSSTA